MNHWDELSRRWKLVGPPLRPAREDLDFFAGEVLSWTAVKPPRALILGVTPEFHALPWPEGTEVRAVDRNPQMIAAIWPGDPALASVGDWKVLPDTGPFDFVLCDGGMNLLSADELKAVVRSVARVLAPSGRFVTRLFCALPEKEGIDQVVTDLFDGKIADVNALKFRLWMALDEGGIRLADVWDAVRTIEPDFTALAARLGWAPETFQTLDSYRDSADRYEFPEPEDMERLFLETAGEIRLENILVPTYPLGRGCPTLVFRKEA